MTKSRGFRKIVLFALTLSILLVLSVSRVLAGGQDTEGDAWLNMNPDTRIAFVRGYTVGLSRGFAEGCDAYKRIEQPKNYDLRDDPFRKCLNTPGHGFGRDVDYYAEQVTAFYTLFPSDRAAPFEEVLKKLSDSEKMTPPQIHEWFKERGHSK
jgi:hypothetical protein